MLSETTGARTGRRRGCPSERCRLTRVICSRSWPRPRATEDLLTPDQVAQGGADDHAVGAEQLPWIDIQGQLVELMPEALQLLDGLRQGRGNRRFQRRAGQRLADHRYPQLLPGPALQLLDIGSCQRRQPVQCCIDVSADKEKH